jgi:hypothetical protein
MLLQHPLTMADPHILLQDCSFSSVPHSHPVTLLGLSLPYSIGPHIQGYYRTKNKTTLLVRTTVGRMTALTQLVLSDNGHNLLYKELCSSYRRCHNDLGRWGEPAEMHAPDIKK